MLAPGRAVALLEPRLRPARRDRDARHGRVVCRRAADAGSSIRSGSRGRASRPDAPTASPYYVDPYADAVHDEPDPEVTESTGPPGGCGRRRPISRRWGTFLADGHDGVLPKAALDRMARAQTMVDEATVEPRLGARARALPARRPRLRRARRRDARVPRRAGRRARASERVRGADERGAGAKAEALALDLAAAALDALPREPAAWRPAGRSARARRRARPLVDGGERDRRSRCGTAASRRSSSAARPAATSRGSSTEAPIAGASSRVASAGSCCGPFARRRAVSRSSTSRRIP